MAFQSTVYPKRRARVDFRIVTAKDMSRLRAHEGDKVHGMKSIKRVAYKRACTRCGHGITIHRAYGMGEPHVCRYPECGCKGYIEPRKSTNDSGILDARGVHDSPHLSLDSLFCLRSFSRVQRFPFHSLHRQLDSLASSTRTHFWIVFDRALVTLASSQRKQSRFC
jgi:hypothetical protein